MSYSFGLNLCVSAVLYFVILVVNGLLVGSIFQHNVLGVWFLPCLGLLLLPCVIVQLVSAVLLLIYKGDKLSTGSSTGLGLLHILQLGFIWRHTALWTEVDPKCRSRDIRHLNYLQLLWTFTSLIPLAFIQTLFIINHNDHGVLQLLAASLTIFGSCFYITSYKHQDDNENDVITCGVCAAVFKIMWRIGELVSRVLCLAIFTTVYTYWVFLILVLHGITILVCLCTALLDMFQSADQSKCRQVLSRVIVAYVYTFVFINFRSTDNSVFRHSLFYIIMFLENAVLLMVWYFHADKYTGTLDKNVIVVVSAVGFCVGILSLIIYSKCFHRIALFDSETEHIYSTSEECINCRLSVCSKHSIKHQRPFSAGWMSQYQKAVSNGNYYKNILQDTYLDSDGNSTADILNSSGEHCQIRDTDLESMKTTSNKQTTVAVQASGTYTHKRFFDSDSIAQFTDTDSISSGSGVYEEDWRQKSVDTIFTQLSAMDALSLVSSRTQLLTDNWDTLLKDNSKTKDTDTKHPKQIDILNSLIRKDLDTSYFSDGYTTDHTLESYQLPVTVLAKKREDRYIHRRIESAYSTASDSTDCTICAFMMQNPSSPEETRKTYVTHVPPKISVLSEPRRKKQRECSGGSSAASRSRRHNRSTDQTDSERSYTHKYEKASSRTRRPKSSAPVNKSSHSRRRDFTDISYADHRRVMAKSELCSSTNTVDNIKTKPVQLQTINQPSHAYNPADMYSDLYNRSVNLLNYSGKSVREAASDSGDSAFPRYTPVNQPVDRMRLTPETTLHEYLVATDFDKDGNSESSCEMII